MNSHCSKVLLCLSTCLFTAALCGCSYGARTAYVTTAGNNTYVDIELEPQLFSTVPVTAGQKEAQYMSFLEEQIQTTLETMSSVDKAEVTIMQNEADKPEVNVMLTLSESAGKPEGIEEYLAEVISNFFEGDIDLAIVIGSQ